MQFLVPSNENGVENGRTEGEGLQLASVPLVRCLADDGNQYALNLWISDAAAPLKSCKTLCAHRLLKINR